MFGGGQVKTLRMPSSDTLSMMRRRVQAINANPTRSKKGTPATALMNDGEYGIGNHSTFKQEQVPDSVEVIRRKAADE